MSQPPSTPSRRALPEGTVARHGRLPHRRAIGVVAKIVAAGVAVVLVSGASVAAIATWKVASDIAPGVALVGEEDVPPQIGSIEGGVNLLLVGSDSGGGNAAYGDRGEVLNDVTMLLHISEDHSRATVVSFPRDLFVDIPECPDPEGGEYPEAYNAKLNTALTNGGLACPVLAIQELTGLEIPYAAVIEFDGVIAMSNAVGGVPVCVATSINDRQIGFKLAAGEHTIQGYDALQFLRSRYGVGDGSDLTRISNQQQFLSSLVRVLKSSETLSNPVKLYGIASAAAQNLEFSNSLRNVDTMVSIAGALKDIPLEEVVFVKYPSASGSIGGQSGVLPIESAAADLFDAIAADEPISLTGGTGGGTVVTEETPPPVDPSVSASVDPSASAPAAPGVTLPDTVEGQTANQETCTAGQTAGG
jgi:LCP family protein required for cell wall assembly